MSTPVITNIEEAEAAWVAAITAATIDDMRVLLHPEFTAVHGAVGHIHDVEQFIADTKTRPRPSRVQTLAATVRDFGEMVTVSCIQQLDVEFAPGLPPFVIQAAVTRVWVRQDGSWQLAHLQMARRQTPG